MSVPRQDYAKRALSLITRLSNPRLDCSHYKTENTLFLMRTCFHNRSMIIYHEVTPESLSSVLSDGLKRTSRGAKTDDKAIVKTDKLLDAHCPEHLRAAGLSRQENIYGYLGTESSVSDIKDGSATSISKKRDQNDQVLLRLIVDTQRCWVSDLDKYDAMKTALMNKSPQQTLLELCDNYWNSLQPLDTYNADMQRPEVMITYNLPPSNIERV